MHNQFLRRADSVTSSDRLMVIRGDLQCVLLTVEDGSLAVLSFPTVFYLWYMWKFQSMSRERPHMD
jgi:hypothetical protein